MQSIEGPARCLGDAVDTDVIAPGSAADFFGLDEEAERALLIERAFSAGDPAFKAAIAPGDILVAGRNFGCGSHRERANRALACLGFRAIVADSVARIFFRNAIAMGQPCFEAPGVSGIAEPGMPVLLDLERWQAEGPSGSVPIVRYSPRVMEIVEAGGILEVIRRRIGEEDATARREGP
jgi:3-isopropylmalate/(R)-2-methylmalate dehydratase small subunit